LSPQVLCLIPTALPSHFRLACITVSLAPPRCLRHSIVLRPPLLRAVPVCLPRAADYFQIVSMFARARIMWPPELKQLFQILSVFNLNV